VVVAGFATPLSVLSRADGRALESPERRRGVPASYATAGDLLVVAVRFGAPSAVEGWTVS
jgi:hypothetical protein